MGEALVCQREGRRSIRLTLRGEDPQALHVHHMCRYLISFVPSPSCGLAWVGFAVSDADCGCWGAMVGAAFHLFRLGLLSQQFARAHLLCLLWGLSLCLHSATAGTSHKDGYSAPLVSLGLVFSA